jgi:hypothetical protein
MSRKLNHHDDQTNKTGRGFAQTTLCALNCAPEPKPSRYTRKCGSEYFCRVCERTCVYACEHMVHV